VQPTEAPAADAKAPAANATAAKPAADTQPHPTKPTAGKATKISKQTAPQTPSTQAKGTTAKAPAPKASSSSSSSKGAKGTPVQAAAPKATNIKLRGARVVGLSNPIGAHHCWHSAVMQALAVDDAYVSALRQVVGQCQHPAAVLRVVLSQLESMQQAADQHTASGM
jgi:hypothetical protein